MIKIVEAIKTGEGYEEAAVNVPNRGFLDALPAWMVVEVPGFVDAQGVAGVRLENMSPGFAGLLANQVAIHDLSAQAIIEGSKDLVLQALLVDPNVDKVSAAEALVEKMIALQPDYLGYLR
jgi:alpha-galactosidase